MRPLLVVLVSFSLLAPLPDGSTAATKNGPERNSYVATYGSQWIGGEGSTSLSGILAYRNLESSYLYTAHVGKQIYHPYDSLYIDVEAQTGTHTGIQDHTEFVGVVIGRWEYFPWDHELDTSFSVGEGLSWASEVPANENQGDDNSAQLLNYVLFEFAASPWEEKEWVGFFRVHHRSGVFGTFSNVYGASNFVGFGLRYHY